MLFYLFEGNGWYSTLFGLLSESVLLRDGALNPLDKEIHA